PAGVEPCCAGGVRRRRRGLQAVGHHRHLYRPPDRPPCPGRHGRPPARLPVGGNVAERRAHPAGPRCRARLSLNHIERTIMTDATPKPIRALFCAAVTQNFFDLPAAEIGAVWAATGEMLKGIRAVPGVTILGTIDDDETMVGTSPNG